MHNDETKDGENQTDEAKDEDNVEDEQCLYERCEAKDQGVVGFQSRRRIPSYVLSHRG